MGPVSPRLSRLALLVAVGASVGTLIRAALERAYPAAPGDWPLTTFLINIVGSLLLGLLLESLLRSGDDTGRRRQMRLLLGTGVLGGFTTYSSFIVEIDQLARTGHPGVGAAYALVSVALGLIAAGVGVSLAGLPGRRHSRGGT